MLGPGLYKKFRVQRTDGRSEVGQKHSRCRYFVLDLDHDRHAIKAIGTYARSCKDEEPQLAADLRELTRAKAAAKRVDTVLDKLAEETPA